MPMNLRPSLIDSYPSLPMPAKGDSTVSPGLLHRRTQRSMVPSCSGAMWRSSAFSRASVRLSVSDSLMPYQMGRAHSIHSSLVMSG